MRKREAGEGGTFTLWRLLWLPLMGMAMAACAPVPAHNPLASWVPSPNYDQRRPVLIVLHFTDEPTAQQALNTLRTNNSGGPVSAHYLIGRDGHIYQLVADEQRAWHAGAGRWGAITDVNSASIGIELDNDGHTAFAQAQIDSLLRLLADECARWRIPRTQIVGHEDFAPGRKVDPGPLFPWAYLAAHGFGRWPRGVLIDPSPSFDPWLALSNLGYPLDDPQAALHSFHHHFRGMDSDTLDYQDRRILYALSRESEPTVQP